MCSRENKWGQNSGPRWFLACSLRTKESKGPGTWPMECDMRRLCGPPPTPPGFCPCCSPWGSALFAPLLPILQETQHPLDPVSVRVEWGHINNTTVTIITKVFTWFHRLLCPPFGQHHQGACSVCISNNGCHSGCLLTDHTKPGSPEPVLYLRAGSCARSSLGVDPSMLCHLVAA